MCVINLQIAEILFNFIKCNAHITNGILQSGG